MVKRIIIIALCAKSFPETAPIKCNESKEHISSVLLMIIFNFEYDNQAMNYIISGGMEGKKRLNVLSEVLHDSTKFLLEMDGPLIGKSFLDMGCGGGNVTLMVAKMVGEKGHVTGVDFDKEIISLAQQDAKEKGMDAISFQAKSAYDITFNQEFDIVYARFLLSHLQYPMEVIQRMLNSLKPGGKIIIEDVQFSGHFCYPKCEAFTSYLQYYTIAARNNHQNPEIGLELFSLMGSVGVNQISFDTIQPSFNKGTGKWMAYITLDKIKDQIIAQSLATPQQINTVLQGLEEFTKDEHTIISLPRIFRVWGYKGN
jgi:2-polyprenyl-3-methyl-5-hydroxy-6-metoxy-1,4-benzoquinol methylase